MSTPGVHAPPPRVAAPTAPSGVTPQAPLSPVESRQLAGAILSLSPAQLRGLTDAQLNQRLAQHLRLPPNEAANAMETIQRRLAENGVQLRGPDGALNLEGARQALAQRLAGEPNPPPANASLGQLIVDFFRRLWSGIGSLFGARAPQTPTDTVTRGPGAPQAPQAPATAPGATPDQPPAAPGVRTGAPRRDPARAAAHRAPPARPPDPMAAEVTTALRNVNRRDARAVGEALTRRYGQLEPDQRPQFTAEAARALGPRYNQLSSRDRAVLESHIPREL